MRIFVFIEYRINKNNTFDSIFQRCVNVADKTNPNGFKRLFYFADSGLAKTSAVGKAIKKFPSLEKFKYHITDVPKDLPTHDALSNLPGKPWLEPNLNGVYDDIGLDILKDIAHGVPRSLPFHYATFIFDNIDWFRNGIVNKQPESREHGASAMFPYASYFSSSIIFQSNWGYSKRVLNLYAVVEIDVSGADKENPLKKYDKIRELATELGDVRNEIIFAKPSEKEKKHLSLLNGKAKELVVDFENNLDSILSKINLPNEFSDSLRSTFDNVSPKKPLLAVFKPLGFKYIGNQSGQGGYSLAKRTKLNNQITLLFDFAPMARALSWSLIIQGPLWMQSSRLKFYQNTHEQFGITGQDILEKVVANAGCIFEYIEGTVIKDIESIYGAAPSWFVYQK